MIAHFEDGFPTAQARGYIDVVDLGNALAARIRAERAAKPRKPPPITHYCQFGTSGIAEFRCFNDALTFYIDHVNDFHPPRVIGVFHDAERSGLTEDEELAVQAAEQEREPRKVRRA